MTYLVRRFITALSPEGQHRLFLHVTLTAPDLGNLKRRERANRLVDAVNGADPKSRSLVEAIAGHVLALADKGDLAERALREVCQGREDLHEILERDLFLEERILLVWLEDARPLDRARNLAMAHHWRDGRFHCGFTAEKSQPVGAEIEATVEAIRILVQRVQGGNKVSADHFTYSDDEEGGQAIHHIAIYLEAPASFLMEFKDDENAPQPILHREAKEVAIDYNPRTRRLDVAAKGIGGLGTFKQMAQAFGQTALGYSELTEIMREEWMLAPFLDGPPSLSPPPGYSSVRVTELITYPQTSSGAKLLVRAGRDHDVYHRLRQLRIGMDDLSFETVHAVTIALKAVPEGDERKSEVRVTLQWPNGRSFDGASLRDREVIEAWLRSPPFLPPK